MNAGKNGLVLLGHGSRDPTWTENMVRVAEELQSSGHKKWEVRCAYIEYSQPDLKFVVDDFFSKGIRSVRILPMFLGMGKHLNSDIPRLIEAVSNDFPELTFTTLRSIGGQPTLSDWLSKTVMTEQAL